MIEMPIVSSTMMPKDMLSKTLGRLKSYLSNAKLKTDRQLFISTIIYLLLLIFMRWRFHPTLDIFFFLAGGIFGIQFLDLAEVIFKDLSVKAVPSSIPPAEPASIIGTQEKSSFRNVLCQVVFVPLSLFMITSSGSLFGTGLVLSVFLSMLYWQWQEYSTSGKIASWFWVIKTEIDQKTQQIYLAIMGGIFILLSLLFV
ncbi:MAG: hypothetical protein V1858_04710 [Candidatus Gottesmanbacteria bacterium]